MVRYVGACLLVAMGLNLSGCQEPVNHSVTHSSVTPSPITRPSITRPSIIIGTYTNGASDGLYTLNGDDAAPELVVTIENPSFAVVDARNNRLYTVSETEAGQVAAYQWDGGQFNLINRVSSEGANPCYLALSPDHTQLAVANYSTGNIAVYELDPETGAIGARPQQRQHAGAGPNQQRQASPHAHWVQWGPDGEFLYAVDLGIDQVVGYPVDETGTLGQGFTAIATAPGSGPRHMVFHPHKNLAYILTELGNTVVVARRQKDGRLEALQTLSTLPEEYSGRSYAAHIAISADGETLYTSNRGHNSITVFNIAESGQLTPVQWASTQGDWPRHFALLPQRHMLLAANQKSDNLVAFDIGKEGLLSLSGQLAQVSQPVFVAPF